jgi:UDP-N-acetylmuramoyl-L-alanyl-D-glutamate--2,6-diaminopimelate ligase
MARWFVDRQPQRGIPSVSLRRLLPEARFVGCEDFEVSGCTADSRRLDPGQVFVAVRGARFDGHAFVAQALERGAAAVVVEYPCPEAGRPQVIVPDARAALARLCQALAGDPSESLVTLGVTGTAGGTLAAEYLRAVFEAAGGRFGLVSRLGWSDGRASRPSGAAVPGAEGLAAMLAEMVERGCAGAVLELGFQALERRRVEGVALDVAVVTDLGGPPALGADEVVARRGAAARLVKRVVPGGAAVVNADEPPCELLGAVNLDARRVAFGLTERADVDVWARVERLDRSGARLLVRGFDREARVTLRLTGPGAVTCALAAAAAAWARGLPLDAVVAGLESAAEVPGRLERVDEGQPFDVRVDGARRAAELQDALRSVRSVTPAPGRLHCVFGAEGARHDGRVERRALAATAEALADRLTLTADNPRTEPPDQILDDLLAGLVRPALARVEPDRALAIEAALADARPGDAVLIAGKGRRTFQIFADRAEPFDDAAVARRWLRQDRPAARRSSA